MRTRQREITEWAQQTFGPASLYRQAVRAQEECIELLALVEDYDDMGPDDPQHEASRVAEECADVYICVARLADAVGCDLEAALDEPPLATDTLRPLCATVNFHLAMLVMLLATGSSPARAELRLRDVVVDLRDVCAAVGRDLLAAVDAKMKVNLAREWRVDGSGCGQHT